MSDELDPQSPPEPEAAAAPEAPTVIEPDEPGADAPTGAAAIFGPFFNAILGPKDCFAALDAKPALSIWIVLWILVFSTVMAAYNMPITQRVMVDSMRASLRAQGTEMSAQQLQSMQDNMMLFGSIFAYASGVFWILFIAIMALAIWVLGAIMGGKGVTFGRAFGIAAAAGVIRPLLYGVYMTVILNVSPPEIRRPEDAATMAPTLGLDIVFSGPDTPVWLHTLFARVDLFLLWHAALVISGSVALLKLSKGQGIAVAAILWVVGTLFAIGGAMLQTLGAS